MPTNLISKLPVSLKAEVEQTFGRPVLTAKDCLQLREDIYSRIKIQISINTLRRLFGLVKADYLPSKSTLGILAKYCGYHSIAEIPKSTNGHAHIEIVRNKNVLNLLYQLCNEVPAHEVNKEALWALVKQVLLFLNREIKLAYVFQRQIAKATNGQSLFFEQFVHIDKLNQYYGDGLRYYIHEKKTIEAKCFGYSLLVFRYWLTLENQKLLEAFEQIQKCQHTNFDNASLAGRCFAARIFHAHVSGLPVDLIMEDAQRFHLNLCFQKEKLHGFSFFEFLVSAALVLTGHIKEGLYFIEFGLEKYCKDQFYEHLGYYHIMNLLKGIAHLEIGDRMKAERIYSKINPMEFGFLSKKFSLILWLVLTSQLKKKVHRKVDLLSALVQDTGFRRFCLFV